MSQKKDGAPFAWWKGASLERIAELAKQAVHAKGWMEDHEMEDGTRYLEFHRADGTEIGGENESHLCPIDCPP